jgi:hypothetical protein
MGFTGKAKSGGGPVKMTAGSHPGVCVSVIELGSHWIQFENKKPKLKNQVLLTFEVPKSTQNPECMQVLHKQFSTSLHENSGLREAIEAWTATKMVDGQDYDFFQLAGKGVLLSVEISDDNWPKIVGFAALPKQIKTPKPVKTPFTWDLSQYVAKKRIPLPDWMPNLYGDTVEEKILASKEIAGDRQQKPKQQSFSNEEAPY